MNATLYGVEGCHRCKFLGEMLAKRGIPYTKVSDVDIIIAKNLDSVPAMEIDGKIMYEMDAISWLAHYKRSD